MWKSSLLRWGVLLGFALGGFFDGILLHQILQWHHLLSLVPGADIRFQVLWDGYFHALMYVLAAIALCGIWRSRNATVARGSLAGALLLGFGAWHVVDAVGSHWILGIHRIRIGSANPLMWDLLWLAVFGLIPCALGWLLTRPRGPTLNGSAMGMILLTIATMGAAGWASRPPSDQPYVTVVFRPGLAPQEIGDRLQAADAHVTWSTPAMETVVATMPAENAWRLYANGALLVTGSGMPAGCFDWARPAK